MWETELKVAEAAAKVGGAVATRHFRGGIEAVVKNVGEGEGTYNMVTQADLDGERAIVEVIRATFPDHAVLGEELHGGGDETAKTLASEHLWIIDPIDGTSNFVHGIPHFGVSVAYYHQGVAACGVVGNPVTNDWFAAARGQGAFHNGRRASVAPNRRIDEVLVGFGYYYDRGAMMEATLAAARELLQRNSHGIRRMGAATLDLAYVGIGSFGAFFEYELAPWDFAAGRLFVEEAGGKVTTCHGEPLPLAKTSLLATNGPLHDDMVAIMDHWFKR
ncbi:inositol monophosphatase family protein [Paludisphaera borealis]|uniref:Inositol-1-monophosphatase n=1 Tax=Paludisphaera borealis TaxID=1387353 RepID=A0A1U7CSS8_9BACT|nr:inositol monophosphatase family protein [Paludisphaera borealis]APW62000.1 Fructose-1,6-bisphosphatase/inositol-1-monophosphatase [Paludisphaera borealis]